MKKFQIIAPEDFDISIEGIEIQSREEWEDYDSYYKMDLSSFFDPNIMIIFSIIAIPSSIDGIFGLIDRIKGYFQHERKGSIKIIFEGKSFHIDKSTSEDVYLALSNYLKDFQ